MEQSVSSTSLKTCCNCSHVNSNNIYDVSRRALSRIMAPRDDIDLPRHVSDRYLIRRLLDLDLLVAHKLALFDLEDQLTFDLILDTSHSRTLDLGRERFEIDDLVNFHSAGITSVDSNLHAWLDVAASCYDTFHCDERANEIGLDFAHFLEVPLAILAAGDDDQVVLPL